jgi:hypothetical protein
MVSWRSSSSQRAARRQRPGAAHTHRLLNLAPPRASLSSSSSPPLSSSSLLLRLRFVPHSSSPNPCNSPISQIHQCSSPPPTPSPLLPRAPPDFSISDLVTTRCSPSLASASGAESLGSTAARRRCAQDRSVPARGVGGGEAQGIKAPAAARGIRGGEAQGVEAPTTARGV